MKSLYLLCFLISVNSMAALKIENGEVLPFSNERYPLKALIKDYAELLNLNATYPTELINKDDTVYFQLNNKTPIKDFRTIFYSLLDSLGFTAMDDDVFLWIRLSEEIRYFPAPVYDSSNFPKDARYNIVLHKLKYPLSSEVTRNLRPFLSRYGRAIDFSDARTILLHETGFNTDMLLKSIEVMDTEGAYKKLLSFQPKKDAFEEHLLEERILEAELKTKLIEKKYLELKEETK